MAYPYYLSVPLCSASGHGCKAEGLCLAIWHSVCLSINYKEGGAWGEAMQAGRGKGMKIPLM